jgi:hypothetical protein
MGAYSAVRDGMNALFLRLEVVLDVFADELLPGLGKMPVRQGWSDFISTSYQLGVPSAGNTRGCAPGWRRSEASVHLGVFADHDASTAFVFDLETLGQSHGRVSVVRYQPSPDRTSGHAHAPDSNPDLH